MKRNTSHLTGLVASAKVAINQTSDVTALDNMRVEYLGKKGHITPQMTTLHELPPEERSAVGATTNEAKKQVQQALNAYRAELESAALNARLVAETTGVFLPGCHTENDGLYSMTHTIDHIEGFSGELGFTVATGPEIEDDYHNFDALSIPGHHPVHADHDIFWSDVTRLLRIQTSGVQVRTMKAQQPSIRIIVPGRVHRNDHDQTYTPTFHQMGSLIVDTNISSTNLKGTLHDFLYNFFEKDSQIRSRPSYFPFTEPSAEVDTIGENGKWSEVLGYGMVHPNVLRSAGIGLEVYSGFAFGTGMERLTILRYGATNLRSFFENDLCFLKQFK